MIEVQRYSAEAWGGDGVWPAVSMEEDSEGDYVSYEDYKNSLKQLVEYNEQLKEELLVTEKLVLERDRLLSMFDCPAHGQCVPYAVEQVQELRKDAELWRSFLAYATKDKQND